MFFVRVRATRRSGLARSRTIRVLAMYPTAGAIKDCHEIGDENDKGGRKQYADHRSQQNVIHAEILATDTKANGDSNHIHEGYVSVFYEKAKKLRRTRPLLPNIQADPLFTGHPHGCDDHAERPRRPSLLSDYLANIGRIDRYPKRESFVRRHRFDRDSFGVVDHQFDQCRDRVRNVIRWFHGE
jgi:hypothetical protein